ncbi:co-chaperone GroES family protein [Tenacibaculum sp. C7A-26P2]|uniref:co-chaperone GroES family protein n=1 Tax=Tenacibaculum sp. C7A-26P2 TaxID=3447504 RepID=UPI003F835120
MKILGERVLVEPIKSEKNINGILLPGTAQSQQIGKVLEVGIKCKVVKKGDRVKYYSNTGVPFEYENIEGLIFQESTGLIAVL